MIGRMLSGLGNDCNREPTTVCTKRRVLAIISRFHLPRLVTESTISPTMKLGKPETVTYRLIDGSGLFKARTAATQNDKSNLHQLSSAAKAIISAK
jgi:hypothetical protein